MCFLNEKSCVSVKKRRGGRRPRRWKAELAGMQPRKQELVDFSVFAPMLRRLSRRMEPMSRRLNREIIRTTIHCECFP